MRVIYLFYSKLQALSYYTLFQERREYTILFGANTDMAKVVFLQKPFVLNITIEIVTMRQELAEGKAKKGFWSLLYFYTLQRLVKFQRLVKREGREAKIIKTEKK